MAKYESIQVRPETKKRFLTFGTIGHSQDSLLSEIMDFYEKYHEYIEQLENEDHDFER